jgi:hypothetical protein
VDITPNYVQPRLRKLADVCATHGDHLCSSLRRVLLCVVRHRITRFAWRVGDPHLKLPLVARCPDSEPLSGGVGDIVAKRAFAWCCLDKSIRSFILQPSAYPTVVSGNSKHERYSFAESCRSRHRCEIRALRANVERDTCRQ